MFAPRPAAAGMDTVSYFLAFSRMAPVQAATWGFVASPALPEIDFYLTADTMEPDAAQEGFHEQIVRLDGVAGLFKAAAIPAAQGSPAAARALLRARIFGGHCRFFANSTVVFASFQRPFAMHPAFDITLERILLAVPDSLLLLLQDPKATDVEAAHWENFMARLSDTVPSSRGRLLLLSRAAHDQYFPLVGAVDFVLDMWLWSAFTTALDAFSQNTPVLSWRGPDGRGRFSASCYDRMGLSHLAVAETEDEFVANARRFSLREGERDVLVAQLSARKHLVFEDPSALQAWVRFLTRAVKSARPAHFPT
jgi:protein O-GlcNAc transferase